MDNIIIGLLFKVLLFGLCYSLILKSKNLAVIDIFWGLSFLPEAFAAVYLLELNSWQWVYLLALTTWALRLSLFLAFRLKTKSKDERYQKISNQWSQSHFWLLSLTRIVIPQGLVSLVMATSTIVYLYAEPTNNSTTFGIIGTGLFLLGFIIETIADQQIRNFKASGRKECFTGGVWKYVRYPNYSGEILIWLGLATMGLSQPFGFLALISPITIAYFLISVTGIPYLEDHRSKRSSFPHKRPQYFLFPGIY